MEIEGGLKTFLIEVSQLIISVIGIQDIELLQGLSFWGLKSGLLHLTLEKFFSH